MKKGGNVRLIRCVDCNEITSQTSYDFYPEYCYDAEKCVFEEQKRDDRTLFEVKHQRHHLEELRVIDGSFISEDPFLEPVKASYFEVTNGNKNFVIRRWRKNIHEPLTYELIPGHLVFTDIKFFAQCKDIRKQFRIEVKLLPENAEEKIDGFIKVVKSIISQMEEKDFRKEYIYETNKPTVSHVKLDKEKVEKIMKRCQKIFTSDEIKKVEEFIRENNEHNGVMTALVERQFEIKKSEEDEVWRKKLSFQVS